MKIAIINDNSKKLKIWYEILGNEAHLFSHPALFLHEIKKSNEFFDVIILDRMFHELDILKDNTISIIKKSSLGSKILLSSALHNEGEKVDKFDYVIDHWPINISKITEIIGTIDE